MHRAHLHHSLSKVMKEYIPGHFYHLHCECVPGLAWLPIRNEETFANNLKERKYQAFSPSSAGFRVFASIRSDQSAREPVHLTILYFILYILTGAQTVLRAACKDLYQDSFGNGFWRTETFSPTMNQSYAEKLSTWNTGEPCCIPRRWRNLSVMSYKWTWP